jgi:hypothetical protein
LAVLKPSRDTLIQINPTLASEPSPYHEVTYPLGRVEQPGGLSLSQDSTIAGGSDENRTKLTVQDNMRSERDLQASRTFAVLRMLESGDNPWDLGSLMLNWKTVMGDDVIDWFLGLGLTSFASSTVSWNRRMYGPAGRDSNEELVRN